MSTEAMGPLRVREMLERALAFTEKLLAENARLRRALAAAHSGQAAAMAADLQGRVSTLESELATARSAAPASTAPPLDETARLAELQAQLASETERYRRLEEQNTSLANLYVASHQLHSTLDFKEVVGSVMEIVANLVGAESFALLLVDGRTDMLHAVAAEGVDATLEAIPAGQGVIGQAVKSGEAWYSPKPVTAIDLAAPAAVVPLKLKDLIIGAIVVFRLTPQKQGAFTEVDHQLFSLLAGHAATALFASKLHGESERKLTTIQGFLDMLATTS